MSIETRIKEFRCWIKRAFDVAVSALLLAILCPLIFIISIAVLVDTGRPVFFVQTRPGYKGKPFRMYKFRTMKDLKDENGNLLPDELRITRLGEFLRSTSLDELPELFNVLKGDMSLVGPRPLLMEYLPLYTPEQMRRHDVKPGMTGLAQVKGRNLLTWEEKFELDVYYVDHWSLILDFCIFLLTVWKVLIREGISQEGHATMPDFTGSDKT
ncbi:MAG TPA: sugar transferase [Fervidobacterium sp.]|nr:sugar transferase [Fervidobacterium sp.]